MLSVPVSVSVAAATCILHYLSLSDRSWSRCPLCFEPVYPQALKSVEFRVHKKCELMQ